MAISKVDFGGRTLIDLTADTVDKHSLKAGYTAHGADGELVEGTYESTDVRGLLDGSVSGAVYDETVTMLRSYAFFETSVESVTLPSLTLLNGPCIFSSCSKLARVDLPKIGSSQWGTFSGCKSLTAVILRNQKMVTCKENSVLFKGTPIASGTGYIYVPAALLDQYKAATNWSVFADQFRAIEDYPEICGE